MKESKGENERKEERLSERETNVRENGRGEKIDRKEKIEKK